MFGTRRRHDGDDPNGVLVLLTCSLLPVTIMTHCSGTESALREVLPSAINPVLESQLTPQPEPTHGDEGLRPETLHQQFDSELMHGSRFLLEHLEQYQASLDSVRGTLSR